MTIDTINFDLAVDDGQHFDLAVDDGDSVEVALGTAIIVQNLEGDKYEGEYIITPKADEDQVLPTRAKTMVDDLTVLRVPYFETSNIYGDTVYIASEVL